MDFSFKKIAAVGVLALGATTAGAAVITDLSERDWLTPGDGLLTFDASSGLEWLDLTVTVGNSILDTEAVSFFGEFRWASIFQIDRLLLAAGLPSDERDTTDPGEIATIVALLNFLGTTRITPTSISSLGVVIEPPFGPNNNDIFKSVIAVIVSKPGVSVAVVDIPVPIGKDDPSFRFSSSGSWLVRDGAPAAVPEPATLSILALGLAGLGFARRQQKS